MLNVMRKHAGSWMIKVILFAIVIVFVFWGVGSFTSRQATKIATVNDEVISVVDYRRVYNNLIEQYRQQFGNSLNEEMIEMLQLKRQALDQLIDRALLLQEAQKLNLRVSDAEVAEAVMNTEVFHTNGSFDGRRYRRILAQVHLTPEEFEADQKKVLLGEKLTRIIMNAAKVPDAEVRQWYDWQNTSVNVDYVFFQADNYMDINPSDEKVREYFAAHKENYKTDPMVATRYVVFDPSAYADQVTLDDEAVSAYYQDNLDEFKTEKTVEARHILIKVDPGADEAADQAARTQAEEIAKLAQAGQDFAELAKTHSQGPTKDKGGYLGKFTRSRMVKPFADKAFSMVAGEISDPVKTQFGWHVIKVESVEEASTKSLEESKPTIIDTLTRRATRDMAYDQAEQFYEGSFEEDDFIKNAKLFGLEVRESGAFSRSGPEALGKDKNAFSKAAFAIQAGEISDIQDIGGKYYLIQVMETIDPIVPELDLVRAEVENDLVKTLQTEAAKNDAEEVSGEIAGGATFEDAVAAKGLTIKQTGWFKRSGAIPEIGSNRLFSKAAFDLSSVGSVTDEPVSSPAGYYLLRLVEKKEPEYDGFESQKETIRRRLLQTKQSNVFQEWLEARKANSRIATESAYLE
jgi:peptidyl-prolyl cis-trans isomerase D